jgi:hypothetical protein
MYSIIYGFFNGFTTIKRPNAVSHKNMFPTSKKEKGKGKMENGKRK